MALPLTSAAFLPLAGTNSSCLTAWLTERLVRSTSGMLGGRTAGWARGGGGGALGEGIGGGLLLGAGRL